MDAPAVAGKPASLRDTLLQAKKSGAKTPQLILPKYPKELKYLADWARVLHRRDNQLTYGEVKAWSELMQIQTNPWEVEALMYLDTIYHIKNG